MGECGYFGGEKDAESDDEEEGDGSVGSVDSLSEDDRSGRGVEGRLIDGRNTRGSQVHVENC